MITLSIVLYLVYFVLSYERDACVTNFNTTLASKILTNKFIEKYKLWLTITLWTKELYEKNRLINTSFLGKREWFIVKNILSFFLDYWHFNAFLSGIVIAYAIAFISGYVWLMVPYFVIGGLLVSLFRGSLFRKG